MPRRLEEIYVVVHVADIGQERTKFVLVGIVHFAVDTEHLFFDSIGHAAHFVVVNDALLAAFLHAEREGDHCQSHSSFVLYRSSSLS